MALVVLKKTAEHIAGFYIQYLTKGSQLIIRDLSEIFLNAAYHLLVHIYAHGLHLCCQLCLAEALQNFDAVTCLRT